MSYKVIDGFLSAEETVAKINNLVELGYTEKDVTIMTKKENKDQLKNITTATIDTITDEENKGLLDKIKGTFSSSDEANPLGKYDLDKQLLDQYNPIIKEGGYVILVKEKTSFTMGRESETSQSSENTALTSGETGDYNEKPGGINPIIPGTGVDAEKVAKNAGDVRTTASGGTDVQDKFNHSSTQKDHSSNSLQDEEAKKANEALNSQPLTGDPVDSGSPGFGIDPSIPPQNIETRTSEDDLVQPKDLNETKEQRRILKDAEKNQNN